MRIRLLSFDDNGVFKVEVVSALEHGWLTDLYLRFTRVVLNMEQELWPSVFITVVEYTTTKEKPKVNKEEGENKRQSYKTKIYVVQKMA